jgi:hypothetical protein
MNIRDKVLEILTNRGKAGILTDANYKAGLRKCPSGNSTYKPYWIVDYLLLNY